MAKILVASDHAGFALKKYILEQRPLLGLRDLGPLNSSPVDYPDYADILAKELLKAPETTFGILICGSGQGMCMRANRYSEIRAALIYDKVTARLARAHNDANVLCLGGRLIPFGLALEIVDTFFETQFEGGRHQNRVQKLSNRNAK